MNSSDIKRAVIDIDDNLSHYRSTKRFKISENLLKQLTIELLSQYTGSAIDIAEQIRKQLLWLSTQNEYEFILLQLTVMTNLLSLLTPNAGFERRVRLEVLYEAPLIEKEFLDVVQHFIESHTKTAINLRDSQSESIELTESRSNILFQYIFELLQSQAKRILDMDDLYVTALSLLCIAGILNKQAPKWDRADFYILCDIVVQYTTRTGKTQLARDLAEEVYLLSLEEDHRHLGLYVQFHVFVDHQNTADLLVYANLILSSLQESKMPTEFLVGMAVNLHRFARNQQLHFLEKYLFEKTISGFRNVLSDRDELQVNLSHFYAQLAQDEDITLSLETYIDSNRERIYQLGDESIFIWSLLILNCTQQYSSSSLTHYIDHFRAVLSASNREKLDALFCANDKDRQIYNTIVSHTSGTRYDRDRVSEMQQYSAFFRKLVKKGVELKDCRYFLSGFRMLYDLSLLQKENENHPGTVAISYANLDDETDYFLLHSKLPPQPPNLEVEIVFIASYQDRVAQLTSLPGRFKAPVELSHWSIHRTREIMRTLSDDLIFKTAERRHDRIYQYFHEDYLKQLETQRDRYSPFTVHVEGMLPVCVYKENSLCGFPDNLLQEGGDFVFLRRPIFTTSSWDSHNTFVPMPLSTNSISLWIPKETGDFTLNLLYSKIESAILKWNVNLQTANELLAPLEGDICMIIAHGRSDIDLSHTISAQSEGFEYFYTNIEEFVKGRKIMVLFVCHSGKVSKNPFFARVDSVVKSLFDTGIQAIIAPRWSLHVEVAATWLPAFLRQLDCGRSALSAFHAASMEVYRVFPIAGAWACLHYYGNPVLKGNEKLT